MADLSTYERPNTVSGLEAKRAELVDLRERYRAEIKKLTVDIDHLEAAIRLFEADGDKSPLQEHVVRHRAEKGSVKRFVLGTLRQAAEPLTSRQITELWVADRGLVADEATYATLRKRIGACIKVCARQGLVVECGWSEDRGERGPYKLWGLAR